jgi:glutathionylspermidine synthase
MADHLVAGEPYLALNAVVLDAQEAAEIESLSQTFAMAFEYACSVLRRDVSALVDMGFPWFAAELLSEEQPSSPLIGRFDFAQDQSGRWRLLEFNADTPSGVRETAIVEEIVQDMLPEAQHLSRPGRQLSGTLIDEFRSAVAGLPEDRVLGLVTDAGELEDVAQMAYTRRLLAGPLADEGTDVILGDVDNVRWTRSGLTLCGRPLGALYRYLPFETMVGLPAFPAIFDAAFSGKLRLLNGLGGLLQQHKGMLAWLWEHSDDMAFDSIQRAAIRDHLPATFSIADCPSSERGDFVAKQVFGREGEEVFFGEDMTADAWETLRRRRTYIAQRRVDVGQIEAAVPTSAGATRMIGCATVGCYVVRGSPRGFYTRFGGKIINSRAKWLATLVDEAAQP